MSPRNAPVELRDELRKAVKDYTLAFRRRKHTALGVADKLIVDGEVPESFLAIYRAQRDEHIRLHNRVETLRQAIWAAKS